MSTILEWIGAGFFLTVGAGLGVAFLAVVAVTWDRWRRDADRHEWVDIDWDPVNRRSRVTARG